MDVTVFATSLFACLLDPPRWIVAGLVGWFTPNRWLAALLGLSMGFALAVVFTPHARGEVAVAGILVTALLAFGVGTWRDRRQTRVAPANPFESLDPARLAPKSNAENQQHVFHAIQRIGPISTVIRSGCSPLERAPLGIFSNIDFDDLVNEVTGHLVAFHAALVLDGSKPLPLAAFALGRAVEHGFSAQHEYDMRQASGLVLGEVLKHAVEKRWSPKDQQLIEAAIHAFMAWDKRPKNIKVTFGDQPWP